MIDEYVKDLRQTKEITSKALDYLEKNAARRLTLAIAAGSILATATWGAWLHWKSKAEETILKQEFDLALLHTQVLSTTAIEKLKLCEKSRTNSSPQSGSYCSDAASDALRVLGGTPYEMRATEYLKSGGHPMVAIFIKDNLGQLKLDINARQKSNYESGYLNLLDWMPITVTLAVFLAITPYISLHYRAKRRKATSWMDII